MITEESQVRLTVELQGRLKNFGHNSSRRERKKAARVAKYGGKWWATFYPATYTEAKESVTINSETVQAYIDESGRPLRISLNEWKKLTPEARLEANLQIHADYLSGINGATYSYEILN